LGKGKKTGNFAFNCLKVPHQKMFVFFNYFRKVTVITEIFYVQILFPTCLVFGPRFFWIKTIFLAMWKAGFPKKHVTITRKILQKMHCCIPNPALSSLTL